MTLKNKQPLHFRCGFRTFTAAPIYSEDSRRADKHKLERFVQPRQQLIASVYAPALYSPAPLLAFLPSADPAYQLLATASAAIASASASASASMTNFPAITSATPPAQ